MDVGVGRGRGRGRGTNGSDMTDLRRPHVPPPEATSTTTTPGVQQQQTMPATAAVTPQAPAQQQQAKEGSTAANEDNQEVKPKKVISLSADAPEFVPRFVPPQNQPQIQAQQSQPHISLGDPSPNMQHQVSNPVVPQPQIQYMCHPVVLQVNNLVVQLTMKPNKFEQVARQLTTIFSWQVQDSFLMKELITVIFEQGVGEVNFRYSGARLCQHLAKHITQSYNGPTFKSLLLQRCHEEFNVRDVYLHSEPTRVTGFTLFLAELFTQLITPASQPLEILRQALCQLLRSLLAQPTDVNLKCVAQVLKFTGSSLDAGSRAEMDEIICTLKDVAMTAQIAQGTRSLLLAVVELRASNWGRGPPSPAHSPASTPTHSNIPLGTVYYGPGGVIQRVEEDLEDSASDTDDVVNYGWSPAVEELEGDVAEAFEEFLKLQQ